MTKRGLWICMTLLAEIAFGQKPNSMRLYVFDCGTLKDRDPAAYNLTRGDVGSVNMADPCFLIVHPKGTMLWETGLNDAMFRRPEGAGPNHDIVSKSLQSQLAEVGYKPSDIQYLAMSHVHSDHSGNANDYAGSTWIVQRAERDFMFGGELPNTVRPNEFALLKNSKTMSIEGDHDVFGDGSVMLISTPGHTPGHQSLLLKLKKKGSVMITGDLIHFPAERTLHKMPEREKALSTGASRERIEALIRKNKARLWIHHDIIGNAKLKKSPAYYD